jgi:hypothetical protein
MNPVSDWATRVTVGDTTRPRSCADVILTLTRSGQPVNGAKVYLRTTYGRTTYRGVTGPPAGPADGQIPVTGVHEGDRIRAYYSNSILNFPLFFADHEITASECLSSAAMGFSSVSLELEPDAFTPGADIGTRLFAQRSRGEDPLRRTPTTAARGPGASRRSAPARPSGALRQ